ncbi:hypothetical protein B4113_0306 [Geobacillus sp. B4113_201601]|nr:hypothetical protein B4113_0306 [Geobacillus sp. B4113_201601]
MSNRPVFCYNFIFKKIKGFSAVVVECTLTECYIATKCGGGRFI